MNLVLCGIAIFVAAVISIVRREWAIMLLLVFVPLEILALPLPFVGSSGEYYKVLPHYLVGAGIIVGWTTCVVARGKLALPRGGVAYWAIAIAFYYLLSLPFSMSIRQSLGYGVIPYCLGLGVFLAVSQALSPRKVVPKFLRVFVTIGVVLALLGILQYYQLVPDRLMPDSRWSVRRAVGTFTDANNLARYLTITVVIFMLYFYRLPIRRAWLFPLVWAFCVVAVYMTLSRAGWLISLGSLTVLIVTELRGSVFRNLAVVMGSIVFVAGSWLFIQNNPIALARFRLLFATRSLEGLFKVSGRSDVLLGGIHMFTDHPLLGLGPGVFRIAMVTKYYPVPVYDFADVTVASHTSMLTILAESGIIGLLLVSGLFAATFRSFCRVRTSADPRVLLYGKAVFSGFLITVVSSQFEGRLFEDMFLWLFLAMLVALEKLVAEEAAVAGN
jgi:hypothetical protein